MIANAGKGELRLRINGTKYDDGGLYTVRLVRVHKQVYLKLFKIPLSQIYYKFFIHGAL